MKKQVMKPYEINSISELHRILELPKPSHPLVSVINFENIKCYSEDYLKTVVYNFYCIAIKKGFEGKMKYGQHYYDFDAGVMTFFSPKQVVSTDLLEGVRLSGWWLVIHPDFLSGYALAKKIREYGYFSYAANEALHLSEKEEVMIGLLIENIQQEHYSPIDKFSQSVYHRLNCY